MASQVNSTVFQFVDDLMKKALDGAPQNILTNDATNIPLMCAKFIMLSELY